MKEIAVIGGGAAGMMAAITAAECGASVTIYERNDRIGKKILATGNGKCNFSNRDFSVEYYYGDKKRLEHYFSQFSVEDTINFFKQAGMLVKEKKGYLYPLSEQASTVLDIMRQEINRKKIRLVLSAEVKGLEEGRVFYKKEGRKSSQKYDAIIITCGGCAAPGTGSDGSGFRLAEKMRHRIVPPVPALVQLRCSDGFFKIVGGVRCEAELALYNGEKLIQNERGELQFTDYGISGIPVFQFSRQAAYILRAGKKPHVYIDLLPDVKAGELDTICQWRMKRIENETLEEFLLGMANKKINMLIIKLAGYKPTDLAQELGSKALKGLVYSYKKLHVHVADTNPFENAQVTAGGVDLNEVKDNLESAKTPGIYFAGEILDVDGRCGGYNLQWAWTSGYIAGKSAALEQ